MFRIPTDRFAEAQTTHNSQVYTYRLDWQSPLRDLGACHAVDLPFVFGTQAEPGIADFAGPGATPLAEKMMDAWIAFARDGDPSTAELPWAKFEASKRSTMLLDADCRVVENPREEERLCWEGKR
jgi:para-nitrobenzyl esterase